MFAARMPLCGLTCSGNIDNTAQIKRVSPLAAVHTLGNLLTNVSLGRVAVSFTHTIKARIRGHRANSAIVYHRCGTRVDIRLHCALFGSCLTTHLMQRQHSINHFVVQPVFRTYRSMRREPPARVNQLTAGLVYYTAHLPMHVLGHAMHFWGSCWCGCLEEVSRRSPYITLAQAMEPFFSVLLSWLFLNQPSSPAVLLSLLPIVGGVAMASVSEVSCIVQ